MLPRSPFRPGGCTFIVPEGFEIDWHIKLWRGCNGKPYLSSSSQLPHSCPGVKGPWPKWHHAIPPVPTVATTGAALSLTSWANNCPRQRARKSDRPPPKTDSFLRTTRSLPLQRSDVPWYVLFPSQVLPQPIDFTEGYSACSSAI
jgi:hypothetical protein